MKKNWLLLMLLALSVVRLVASPVGADEAMKLGLKFAQNNLASAKQVTDLSLAYSQALNNGQVGLYIYNFDGGFVIVAGDEVSQPILGYSEEGSFDAANMPVNMASYLDLYIDQMNFAIERGCAPEQEILEQWNHVRKDGFVNDNRSTSGVEPMVNLNWNQDNPYNRLCPVHNYGPGGHVYAGCVATAMSMVMKFWNWPEHGSGTHTYTPDGFPAQTADFENTYYDWDNMPIAINTSSPSQQIDAIARLMWHCGIAVDMQYAYNGSGAYTQDVPGALINYFRYSSHVDLQNRDSYSKTQWEDMLIANFDEGFPAYYAGSGSGGGHAFVCDGYRDSDRKMHFNWGWSGYANGYFAIDALTPPGYVFNENNSCVFDMIPDYIYDALIPAASDLTAHALNANSKTGVITWTNPDQNLAGEQITNIDKVVLLRNGQEIFSEENVAPGESMRFEDEVDDFDCYEYRLYYMSNNVKGRVAKIRYQYGPTCTWKVICTTTNFQGWNGGKLQILNAFGSVLNEITMTSSTPVSEQVAMPEGSVSFKWVAPASNIPSLSINIKDSSNSSVYSYNGASSGLNGVIFSGDNDCAGCLPPDNLEGAEAYENTNGILLSWEYSDEPKNFRIYRSLDNVDYELVGEADKAQHEYFDAVEAGTYYYKVTAYRNHCESTPAWATDGNDYVLILVTSVCEEEQEMNLYPNPVNGTLNVEVAGMTELVISNVMGQVVSTINCDADLMQVNTTAFESGIYTLTVRTANGIFSSRFTVLH